MRTWEVSVCRPTDEQGRKLLWKQCFSRCLAWKANATWMGLNFHEGSVFLNLAGDGRNEARPPQLMDWALCFSAMVPMRGPSLVSRMDQGPRVLEVSVPRALDARDFSHGATGGPGRGGVRYRDCCVPSLHVHQE